MGVYETKAKEPLGRTRGAGAAEAAAPLSAAPAATPAAAALA